MQQWVGILWSIIDVRWSRIAVTAFFSATHSALVPVGIQDSCHWRPSLPRMFKVLSSQRSAALGVLLTQNCMSNVH